MKRAKPRKPGPFTILGVQCAWLEEDELTARWSIVWDGGWGPSGDCRRFARWLERAADWCEAQEGRGR